MTIFASHQWNSEKVKKTFIVVVISLAILEVSYLAYLLSPLSKAKPQTVSVPLPPPSLSFAPEKLTVKKGEKFTLTASISTAGKEVKGLDVVIKYDPEILELTDVPQSGGALTKSTSNTFDVYPENSLDKTGGVITFSAIKNKGGSFSGNAVLGTVNFKVASSLPKKAKETAVWFIYRQGASDESNLIDAKTGQDILGKVKHATIVIQ